MKLSHNDIVLLRNNQRMDQQRFRKTMKRMIERGTTQFVRKKEYSRMCREAADQCSRPRPILAEMLNNEGLEYLETMRLRRI